MNHDACVIGLLSHVHTGAEVEFDKKSKMSTATKSGIRLRRQGGVWTGLYWRAPPYNKR